MAKKKTKRRGKNDPKTALIIPDCHIPYHDRRAYELMLEVAMDQESIDEIVILGDYADFYGVNSHGISPSIEKKLTEEIDIVIEHLQELNDFFPDAKKVFIQGNHEYRLERYLKSKAPELFGIVDTEKILQLKELGYKYIPYTPNQKYNVLDSKLMARHEPIGGGVHAAHSTVIKSGCSVIFGHIHRIQESQVVMMNGDNHRGISCGWLGDKDHEAVSYVKSHHQWSLGFNLIKVLPNKNFFSNNVHIIDYKCCYGGKVYEG